MNRPDDTQQMSEEILEHLMHPKNYGKLELPDGVGIGYDEKSGEYVIFYLGFDGETISELSFATNGCQDTVILGSVFTEMIKATDLKTAQQTSQALFAKVQSSPPKQQACATMVLTAFDAALINRDTRRAGGEEEVHSLAIDQSCAIEEPSQ